MRSMRNPWVARQLQRTLCGAVAISNSVGIGLDRIPERAKYRIARWITNYHSLPLRYEAEGAPFELEAAGFGRTWCAFIIRGGRQARVGVGGHPGFATHLTQILFGDFCSKMGDGGAPELTV